MSTITYSNQSISNLSPVINLSRASSAQDTRKMLEAKISANPDALLLAKNYLLAQGYPAQLVNGCTSIGYAECYTFELVMTDFSYDGVQKVFTPEVIADQEYYNKSSSSEITDTFTYSRSISNTFAYKFTEGLKIGTSAKVKAGIPFIAGGEVSISGEISFGAEQQWSKTETKVWSSSETIKVPAQTNLRAVASLSIAAITANFVAKVRAVDGKVFTGFQMSDGSVNALVVPLLVLLPNVADREMQVSGIFQGSEGIHSRVELDPIN